jgi:hypothetical protein
MSDTVVAHLPSTPKLAEAATNAQALAVYPPPLPTSADQSAPADLVPPPRWWERLVWYLGATLLSSVLIFTGLRLDQADLKAPFYYDLDSLLILPMVKSTVERGFGGHWRTEKLGAPGILELHDFPVIDHLHFLLIWLLSKVVPNLILLYNLYFLLTFPLTTFTAMLTFRQLRLTLPAAAVGGVLYSFLPYHYQRWENHYFLAAYWMVPLSLLPVFAIYRGELPFFRQLTVGCYHWRLISWGSLGFVVLALAVASSGAYYAFFACAFTAFTAVYSFVAFRMWHSLVSALLLIAFIVLFGTINHLPTFFYQAEYGVNPVTERVPEDADVYGLKLTHLILPIEDHNLRIFARYKWYYNAPTRPAENENKSATLGIVGVVGLIGLILSLLFPNRLPSQYKYLAALTAFGVLLATIGGFGSIFNLLVTAQIRGYNRISVFIAFFCLLATLRVIDTFLSQRPRRLSLLHLSYAVLPLIWLVLFPCREISPRTKARIDRLRDLLRQRKLPAKWLVWPAILIVGFLDQTPYAWFKSEIVKTLNEQANRYRADDRFFAGIEQSMPPESKIFCLPYVPYPESPPVQKMPNYEHARGYIHTGTLTWSYGAMKGREADAWQMDVSFRDTDELLQRIVYRGFDGVLIDMRGYPTQGNVNKGSKLVNDFNKKYSNLFEEQNPGRRNALLPLRVHEDGQQIFLDLRPYREVLKKANPKVYEAKVKEEEEWVAVLWLGGFYTPDISGDENMMRFGPPDADAWLVNPSDRTRTFVMSMTFHPHGNGTFHMKLSGLVEDEFSLDKKLLEKDLKKDGQEKKYRIEVPPGRHAIHIHCSPAPQFIPDDSRRLCYYLKEFKFEEQR